MKKSELIHASQLAEGYIPCFERSNGQCLQTDCCFKEDWNNFWGAGQLRSASFGYFSGARWFWWLAGPIQKLKVNKEKSWTEGSFHRTSNKSRITSAQLKKIVLDNRTEACLYTRVEPLP